MAKKETWLPLPFQLSQEVDRLFDELIHRPWGSRQRQPPEEWNPELDLYETEEAFILEVDLPGVKEKDVSVHIDHGDLVLTGRRVCERVTDQSNYHRHERREGQFIRRLQLPMSVVPDKIQAVFHEGVLRVTLPKYREESRR
ncbi:MAG: Hsp20/alpha crystallin family protein [Deltaproteobacteria bacterium]|nr:Hsp20/alpha crystallin family protein [Deltaproteobacteria bacterium]